MKFTGFASLLVAVSAISLKNYQEEAECDFEGDFMNCCLAYAPAEVCEAAAACIEDGGDLEECAKEQGYDDGDDYGDGDDYYGEGDDYYGDGDDYYGEGDDYGEWSDYDG